MSLKMIKLQSGFTLLEILITAVILSIGLLGLAGMQVFGLRNNHSAYMRSQATLLAYDMADRMRANPVGFRDDSYNNPTATEHSGCVSTTGCSAAEMAEHDMFEWSNTLSNQLPSGSGVVCLDSTPDDGTSASPACSNTGNVYAIKIWWNDDRSNNLQRFVTSFQP